MKYYPHFRMLDVKPARDRYVGRITGPEIAIIIVSIVIIRLNVNTAFSNMYNLCMKELLIVVNIVTVWKYLKFFLFVVQENRVEGVETSENLIREEMRRVEQLLKLQINHQIHNESLQSKYKK